jgi:hypothetical protein
MTLIRKLAWVLFWVSLCTTFSSNSQDISVTGNLVNNSITDNNVTTKWQNVGSWNQGLPCWKGGDPGCTSQPYFNNGSFNFSYGTTNVSQAVNISTALANSGTGLQVNGFNFGFTAKNGNGWDDGRQDYLIAYANFKNTAGTIVQSYDYSNATNTKYNWTTFNFSETFTTPYAVKNLSTATYGFIGRDNNYWMGPYGPEIKDINFSLKYSVAPPPPTPPTITTTTNTTTTIVPTTTTTATPTVSSDPTSAPVTSVTVGGVQLSSEGTVSVPDSIPQVVKDAQPSAATTTTTQTTPPLTTATASTESNKSKVNMTLVMNTIKSVQENVKTIERIATQNASKQLAAQIANSQEQTSQAMASTNAISSASSQSSQAQPSSVPQLIGGGPAQSFSTIATTTQQVQVAAYTPPKMQMAETQTVAVITSELPKNGTGLSISFQNTNSSQQISYSLLPQPVEQIIQKPVFFQSKQESRMNENELHVLQSNNFANRTNPINQVLEQRMILESSTTEQKVETVKSNVAPNELAGGVDIASIASLPKGYDGYVNFTMKDVSFYKVEDIYKNQNTVDNVRAMRQLSSDRLHQEMVNQQYRN